MHEIINKFLLAGDKFMPEMLKTTWIYMQCLWIMYYKEKKNIKFIEKGDSRYIY